MPAEGLKQGQTVAIHQFLIRLIDEAWQPVWLEHPRYGASVDAATIPFNIPEGYGDLIVENWAASDAGTQSMATKLWVSQNVAVVGYPYGLRGRFDLPIWTAGSVSSEPAMLQPYRDRAYPFFLIDARTRSGQSGSPVVSVRQPMSPSAISDKQVQFSPAPQWRLVGVYGGRVPENYGDRRFDLRRSVPQGGERDRRRGRFGELPIYISRKRATQVQLGSRLRLAHRGSYRDLRARRAGWHRTEERRSRRCASETPWPGAIYSGRDGLSARF